MSPLIKSSLVSVSQYGPIGKEMLSLRCSDLTYDLDLAYYDQVVFLVNDVHYYLSELSMSVTSPKVTFEVSGI